MVRSPRKPRRLPGTLAAVSILAFGALPARADRVLHEYFPPDPVEDLRFGATTGDGAMSAAIQTENGPVPAPDFKRPPAPTGVYDEKQDSDSGYRVDSNTSQPPRVSYDDPFTPDITPFKRLFAYDRVSDSLDLIVDDPRLTPIEVGGAAKANDDQFFGDIQIEVVAGEAVRIPSVGPTARVLGLRTEPPTAVELLHDGADNWFVRAKNGGRVRLALQLAIDRAVFGSEFADVDYRTLEPKTRATELSPAIRTEALDVAARIGVTGVMTPAAVVRTLVSYFRSFAPSNEHPRSTGLALYRELALSRKGVCRHRAFAFVVTAIASGIPARMVHNEAHAWVEAFDGARWHRIDLGGAAGFLEEQSLEERPTHILPRDPYTWPPGSDSGQALAERTRAARRPGPPSSSPTSNQPELSTASRSTDAPAQSDSRARRPDDSRPPSQITLRVGTVEARRGGRVQLSGEVEAEGEPCALARVDFFLKPKESTHVWERIPLGVLVTNDQGRYDGRVVVPHTGPSGGSIGVGDYEVIASTPGNPQCGAGQAE